ncbi:MAG: VOC family protein, partial [Limnohabitans sp.]
MVAARSLEQGVAWCEATLGITPHAGGAHEQFGTHNRLFKIATPRFALAYFEIIAINPFASTYQSSTHKRWFDLDDDALQASIAQQPTLIHFVVSITDIHAA